MFRHSNRLPTSRCVVSSITTPSCTDICSRTKGPRLPRISVGRLVDNGRAGGNADPATQRSLCRRLKYLDRRAQRKPGVNGLLDIVFVRGMSEMRDDHVADGFGDTAAERVDHLGDAALIGFDSLPHVFEFEPAANQFG